MSPQAEQVSKKSTKHNQREKSITTEGDKEGKSINKTSICARYDRWHYNKYQKKDYERKPPNINV